MSLCSRTELTALTGTEYDDAIQQEIIDQSDREIKARLALAEISAPSSDDKLKVASLNLSIAGVLTRMRLDGSRPSSLRIGDITITDNLDSAIVEFKNKANEMITSYILTHGTYDRYRWMIWKVN